MFDNNGKPWFKDGEESLAFFLNIYNFMVLFGLCKNEIQFPSNNEEWINYICSISLKVGPHIFSALEIRCIMFDNMLEIPAKSQLILDKAYPFYTKKNPKSYFKYPKQEPFIDFGFYSPYKSFPELCIYTSKNVVNELKQVAARYFISNHKSFWRLKLPPILKKYDLEITSEEAKNKFKKYIISNLPEDVIMKYRKVFKDWYCII